MDTFQKEIANAVGSCNAFLDLGAGNCRKASQLFNSIKPRQYHTLGISKEFLEAAVADLQIQFPHIEMYAHSIDLSPNVTFPDFGNLRKIFFFPGSSVGNYDPDEAVSFFSNLANQCNGNGGLLVGVDLIKDVKTLDIAYNDARSITAAFNRNALNNVNRLIGSNFNPANWEHYAFFNESKSRIEMYLRAIADVKVTISGSGSKDSVLNFKVGDLIHTENSYKYT